MSSDIDREIADEVTRTEAIKYLQGALGHAVASLLFLLFAGTLWIAGFPILGLVTVFGAALLSANGVSIWAWNRLREYFTGRVERTPEQTRTLKARPLSSESLVEMQSGAVMVLVFVSLLLIGRALLSVLGSRHLIALCIGGLTLGNVTALVMEYYSED